MQVKSQQHLQRQAKEYENVMLADKTGQIDSKIWDVNSGGIGDFDVNDYVYVSGQVTSYNGALQFKIERARVAAENEYSQSDYIPASRFDIEDMYRELLGYVNSIENVYIKQLLTAFLWMMKHLSKDLRIHQLQRRYIMVF